MRFDFVFTDIPVGGAAWFALVAVIGQLVIGGLIGPYAVGHQRGSFEEIVDVARTVAGVALGLFVWAMTVNPVMIPRSIPISAGALALMAMFALRFAVRTLSTSRYAAQERERRVILFGAGEAGRRLLRSMLRDGDNSFIPVAMLDDDKSKARLRIEGIRVRGTRDDLAAVAAKYEATDLAIALPNSDAALIRDVTARAEALGLRTMVLPPLRKIMDGQPTAHDLRDVNLGDLLGRRPIELDQEAIAEQISGRTVLVTGAGGSIGSELCRQIAKFGPAKLLLLDRDESALHATQLSLAGHGLLDDDSVLLVDIRDPQALRAVFQSQRPEVVFHAAALKHLPLLERYPLEAWKSNVIGTLNVLQAADDAGVGTFVNISTDKAANPSCVLGYSKRVAERLTADFARRSKGRFVSVRFGNVLGSRGSVVPAFTAQIERGGPVTVTHPDVRRFFMLIPEACQLVLEAAALGSDGEVMVLEMGEQVKIVDVAHTLIRMSGRTDVEVNFTGLRPGEKLAEELFYPGETREPTAHPLVSSVSVPLIDADWVREVVQTSHDDAAEWMRERASRSADSTDTVSAGH
ncbi:nucleoside-diphosphate sugar epimerase/dehydratase [Rhodococcus sp. X156]|uniref:polysaccharide biosynthesis protein n=1 Tax=Rhodococcus sp. X156 TaxID=2499145 RepID=UPI0019D2D684|nr:nucleoside-diphosphate sugar epimerase/dehydratase [Rhodococcus sp. X156]